MHRCPGPGHKDEVLVGEALLACAPHWYQVPKELRTAVWRSWRRGEGAGTDEHNRAIVAAIAAMRPL